MLRTEPEQTPDGDPRSPETPTAPHHDTPLLKRAWRAADGSTALLAAIALLLFTESDRQSAVELYAIATVAVVVGILAIVIVGWLTNGGIVMSRADGRTELLFRRGAALPQGTGAKAEETAKPSDGDG